MARLSNPLASMKDHYTVVVVGSGYGGSIAASRLARAGRDVCLLERGREFVPGEYPDTELEALAEFQADLPDGHVGPDTGLYDFRVNREINAFVGCGLGGTSLVNANVSLRPEDRVFQDPAWPRRLRADIGTRLAEGFRRAEEMLRPVPCPEDPPLAKLRAHETSAARFPDGRFSRPPINVTFEDGVNRLGVDQRACIRCGDCVSGCNHNAKNTLVMNYLPDARNHGAEIHTQAEVRRVVRDGDRWRVGFRVLGVGRERFDGPEGFVTADTVILAAGTLGSTEILLRSRAGGLPVSDRLGHGFTGNGDVLAFGYNADIPIHGIGIGPRDPSAFDPVGPCITGLIDLRERPDLGEGMVVEEGAMPGAVGAVLPGILRKAAKLMGTDTDPGIADAVRESWRELESLIRGPHQGAADHTQTFLVMAHDDGGGRLRLEDDRIRIDWPGVGKQAVFEKIHDRLAEATRALGGTLVPNPIWHRLLGHDLITVHPLGGCGMAEDAVAGVTDHAGAVFSGTAGTAVHDGLYVWDGAVIPRSLGVNPLLTISALAERACALLAEKRGWTIPYDFPPVPDRPAVPEQPGIRFTETMRGHISTGETADFTRAEARGVREDSPFVFIVTIEAADLDAMIDDPEHRAVLSGTAEAPALSAAPMTVTDGAFQLFVRDPDRPEVRQMRYSMVLHTAEGKAHRFTGFKDIRQDPGADLWADTTTLYVTIHQGPDASSPPLALGILHITAPDFLKQMTTMAVTGVDDPAERLSRTARFGRFFAGELFDTYGGVFGRPTLFNPDAPPRKKRLLRTSAPHLHHFRTSDGVRLRLTRYRGGAKGPVLLAHGLGVSGRIFTIDTIETNLTEYLFALGYDVWILDYRASIELPASRTRFTADDVATRDYPAAVERVLGITGAESLQAVVHCFGSTTFFMAMLAGLTGVRSVVCSQVATHIDAPLMTRIKTGLHLPEVMDVVGIDSLDAYTDVHADWDDRLVNQALRLAPTPFEERCANPVCHRIAFLYAPLYEHDRLNAATHRAMHEMFGVANIESFKHLGTLVNTGHLVDAGGGEVYMNHPDRLALPIAFLHGAENACFKPSSTEKTYHLLREANGDRYERHVISGYGHIDCIFGKDAVRDVYPLIHGFLEKT